MIDCHGSAGWPGVKRVRCEKREKRPNIVRQTPAGIRRVLSGLKRLLTTPREFTLAQDSMAGRNIDLSALNNLFSNRLTEP